VSPGLEDTIVAAATPVAPAGLAVVRVSGSEALAVAARLFEGTDLHAVPSHTAHHGWVHDARGERLDEVLALVLRAPRSYTGEDTVEISCHGSPLVVEELVAAAVAAGARVAEAGEFTRRAFLNGRIDLSQAEAVADLIAAESRAGRRAALEQLRGTLAGRVQAVRAGLVELLGDIEASIDFVEEDLEFFERTAVVERARTAAAAIDALLDTASDGMLLRSGVRVSLAGAPNVGKSSLFNRLLREPRSIVTEHPGTTRDVVRETLRVGALAVALEDTAGLRATTPDPIERLGIERSLRSHAEADVVLQVLDATRPLQAGERDALEALDAETALVVLNKIDALPEPLRTAAMLGGGAHELLLGLAAGRAPKTSAVCVAVSATTGDNIEALIDALTRVGRLRRL
jgi:tRNA modification GTPase